ncbi:hypothetical protein ACFLYD_08705 [Chloroflexota bacterium]
MQNRDLFLLDPDHEPLARGIRPKFLPRGQGCLLLFAGIFGLAGLCFAAGTARE